MAEHKQKEFLTTPTAQYSKVWSIWSSFDTCQYLLTKRGAITVASDLRMPRFDVIRHSSLEATAVANCSVHDTTHTYNTLVNENKVIIG